MPHRDTNLHVTLRPIEGATVLLLDGEVDVASADHLTDAVRDLVGPGAVVVDFAGVSFMDSSGVRALLDAEELARAAGRAFAIVNPSRAVVRLLDLIDLRSRFVELPGLDERAIAGLGRPDSAPPAERL